MKQNQAENGLLPVPLSVIILYALGQAGWSLAVYGVSDLLNYFYLPPETSSTPLFPSFIYQGAVFGIATVLGLISFSGRFIDAFIDPMVAGWSDRTVSKLGRRRKFMTFSFIPLSLFSCFVFMPLFSTECTANMVWLCLMLFLFYFSMSLYVTPYTALISELAHTPERALLISTLVSVTWALGFGIGNSAYALMGYFQHTWALDSVKAFQATMALFGIISAILMAIPVLFVNERKYCLQIPSEKSSLEAVKSVFANRNFRFFALSDLMYWISLTFIQMGMGYYLTVLLNFQPDMVSTLLTVILGLSFVFYIPVNMAAKRWGKRNLLIIAFAVFTVVFAFVALMGKLPLSSMQQAIFLGLLASIPIAIASILPNAVVTDIIAADAQETGDHKAGQFFAVRTFMMKVGISVANLLFPSILLLGKSTQNDMGIRLTAALAVLFCLSGALLLTQYREKETKN
jgi:GPH family glycoside/pentoside/hexuronide:cation symporter